MFYEDALWAKVQLCKLLNSANFAGRQRGKPGGSTTASHSLSTETKAAKKKPEAQHAAWVRR